MSGSRKGRDRPLFVRLSLFIRSVGLTHPRVNFPLSNPAVVRRQRMAWLAGGRGQWCMINRHDQQTWSTDTIHRHDPQNDQQTWPTESGIASFTSFWYRWEVLACSMTFFSPLPSRRMQVSWGLPWAIYATIIARQIDPNILLLGPSRTDFWREWFLQHPPLVCQWFCTNCELSSPSIWSSGIQMCDTHVTYSDRSIPLEHRVDVICQFSAATLVDAACVSPCIHIGYGSRCLKYITSPYKTYAGMLLQSRQPNLLARCFSSVQILAAKFTSLSQLYQNDCQLWSH